MMEFDFQIVLISIVIFSITVYLIVKIIRSIDYSMEDSIHWERLRDRLINHYSFIEPNEAVSTYNLYQNVLGILHRYNIKCYAKCTISFVKDTIVLTRTNVNYSEDFTFSIIEDKFYIEYTRSDMSDIKRPITMENLDKLFFKTVK